MNLRIFLFMIASAAAVAQTPTDGPGIAPKMKQNAEALHQYSYKRRTQITIKGQPRATRVDLVRYINGKEETVPLETPQRPAGQGRGGMRGRMIQKKKEEMKEDVERLTSLLHRYISPGSDSLRAVLEKAAISRTGPQPDADIQLVSKGIVDPSDSLTLTWSVANKRPEKIAIKSKLEGKPVELTVDFAALPDGPFYPAHSVVSLPKKDLIVNIDTFDYVAL
jgi:hypothetical protein